MRFTHALVPLDGSRLAESALPPAAAVVGVLHVRLTLLHVLERHAPVTVHGERHLRTLEEGRGYLGEVAAWLAARGVTAATEVVPDEPDVAGAIAHAAAERGADVVALATHGRTGLRGMLYGRVAQQVLARGTVPVMLVPASIQGRERAVAVRRILVPLDGSPLAETALAPAQELARAFGAAVHVVWVIPTPATLADERAPATLLMPTAAQAVLDAEAEQAAGYVGGVADRLRLEGVETVPGVERGDPVRRLLELIQREQIDLTVMATHGRAGLASVWAGSVTSRFVGRTTGPVLLIPLNRREEAGQSP